MTGQKRVTGWSTTLYYEGVVEAGGGGVGGRGLVGEGLQLHSDVEE